MSERILNGVVWIMGFSGAGKSTLAGSLAKQIRHRGYSPILMDADDLKEVFRVNGYKECRQSRVEWGLRTARLCRHLSRQGYVVIRPNVGLLREVFEWNRYNLDNYFEIVLDTPIAELIQHDEKGLYRKISTGQEKHMFGVDLEPDWPSNPDWICDFRHSHDARAVVEKLTNSIIAKFDKERPACT